MISSILFVSGAIFFAILCYADLKEKKRYMKKLGKRECQDVPLIPLLGNILTVILKGYLYAYDWINSKDPSGLCWIFTRPIYYTRIPEELQIILLNKNSLRKGNISTFLGPVTLSLVATNVDTWRPHRRLLNKCFSRMQIYEFTSKYNDFSKKGMDKILSKMTAQELSEALMTTTVNAFFGTIGRFGSDEIYSKLTFNLYKTIQHYERLIVKRLVNPWLILDFIFSRTKLGRINQQITCSLEENQKLMFEYMRKQRDINRKHETNNMDKNNFLNILVDEYQPKEMIAETFFFLAAAEHTTSTTLATVLLLLGMHRESQNKVYQEVIDVVGPDDPVENEHLPKLKYTLMVIQEALRILPAVNQIARYTENDIDLGGGYCLPRGTEVILNIQGVHRDEKIWKDPLKFIPERFTPEEIDKRHPCSFIPFSYGSRNCIAFKFAEVFMKVYLANIVRKYSVISSCKRIEDIVPRPSFLLQLPDNIDLQFKSRCS